MSREKAEWVGGFANVISQERHGEQGPNWSMIWRCLALSSSDGSVLFTIIDLWTFPEQEKHGLVADQAVGERCHSVLSLCILSGHFIYYIVQVLSHTESHNMWIQAGMIPLCSNLASETLLLGKVNITPSND